MLNNTPTITDLIDARIIRTTGDLHTSLPCSVVRYDPNQQSVDVQPLLQKEYSNEYVANLPIIQGLPLVFPGAGNSLISFPVNVGDIVLAVFCEKSIDKWVRSNGKPVNPKKGQMHDLSDAFAIPGLQTFRTHNNPNPDNFEIRFDINGTESSIKIMSDGTMLVTAPTSITFDTPLATFTGNVTVAGGISVNGTGGGASGGMVIAGDIDIQGTITSDEDVIASGISLNSHTHGGVQTGAGNTGGPQ